MRRRAVMTRSSALLRGVFAQMKSSPKIWDAYHAIVIEPRRRRQVALLRRGQEAGELRTDIDVELMNDMVVGPMLMRTVMLPDADLPEGLSEQIVDAVLEGLRPVREQPAERLAERPAEQPAERITERPVKRSVNSRTA
jgi:hypothetical protein